MIPPRFNVILLLLLRHLFNFALCLLAFVTADCHGCVCGSPAGAWPAGSAALDQQRLLQPRGTSPQVYTY